VPFLRHSSSNNDIEIWVRGYSRSLKMAFESLDMVLYSYSIATMAVSLAISTQYTNVTDRQTVRLSATALSRTYA